MPNPHYVRSRRKEQELVRNAKKAGRIGIRSAGSKSPIDVVDIDHVNRIIHLIQVKTGHMTQAQIDRLNTEFDYLNFGEFEVRFEVCHFP